MDLAILADDKEHTAVTQTNATTSDPGPVFPPGRYGHRRAPRRHPRRWLPALLAAATALAGLAVAVRLYQQYGAGPYDAQVVRFTDVTDRQVVVQFQVNLPAGAGATCVVRARDRSGVEVGRQQVRVAAGPDRRPLVSHRLATTARPVTGEVAGCGPAR